MAFCTVFFTVQSVVNVAYADDGVSFDKTSVLEDLQSSTINGQSFDLNDYPADVNGSVKIVNFVEYCYSATKNMRENYGLYIYVYNPQKINFSTTSQQNKIQIAVTYDEDGKATRYEKFHLVFCDKSDGDYRNLFYKFKVEDKQIDGKHFADRVNASERRYDISGVELLTYGKQNAVEYKVGGTYRFTGFAKGYGADESTLACEVEDLETCKLDVYHTYFRTEGVSALGAGHYNEVNTVYFELPNHYLRDYGRLQKIRAEWWEYKTKEMFVTSNADFYEQLLDYVGTTEKPDWSMYYGYRYVPIVSGEGITARTDDYLTYDWAYNIYDSYETNHVNWSRTVKVENSINAFYYAFYSKAVNNIDSLFSFLYSKPVAGNVADSVVQKWVYDFINTYGSADMLTIDNGRQIPACLFETYVDDGRTIGYNDKTIDLADTFDLKSYDSNHSWWDKLWTFGFSWPSTNEEYADVAPIYILKAEDVNPVLPASTISTNLLVNENDVADIQALYAHAQLNDCSVVLFRFANTDYFAKAVGRTGVAEKDADTYFAQETMFFDFDIIELTFNKDGVYRVIPVVASPIDIINGITAPPQTFDWWKLLLMLLALILFLLILAPILPYIIKGVVWLVSAPIKAIKKASAKAKTKQKSNTKRQVKK